MDESSRDPASEGQRATVAEVAERLAAAEAVLITCHRGPDGDSVGSMVALASLLKSHGKKATLYNPDPVPRRYKWLPLAKSFQRRLGKTARFTLTIVVDCADAKLLGSSFPGRKVTGDIVVLDHHSSGRPFGDLFLCDPEAACVGVLVARVARRLSWEITRDAALGIYVSLVADTGSFSYANTNSEAFHLAADLVGQGVDPWLVHSMLHERDTIGRYKLLCKALATLEFALEGKVAFMTITREMVKDSGATWDDTTDLVNYTRSLDGVECGVLLTSAKHGGARVSMRSKGLVDAGRVCAELGGGGHRGAAGCIVDSDLDGARDRIGQLLADALGTERATETGAESTENPEDAQSTANESLDDRQR